jgi:hypothetical protein
MHKQCNLISPVFTWHNKKAKVAWASSSEVYRLKTSHIDNDTHQASLQNLSYRYDSWRFFLWVTFSHFFQVTWAQNLATFSMPKGKI